MKYLLLAILLTGCGVREAGPRTVIIKAGVAYVCIESNVHAPKEVRPDTDIKLPLAP
tara:strand:- start:252 stop:422 length:171 start_codon:yes stop_codon:yes gene_type:complete